MNLSNRHQTIAWQVSQFESNFKRCRAAVADTIAKMSKDDALAFHYQVRWGRGVAEDYLGWWLKECLDYIGKCERGELEGAKTMETLCDYYVDALTRKLMRVEHSSSPFACAVALAEHEVHADLLDQWTSFKRSLIAATRDDEILSFERAAGIARTSIEVQRRTLNDPALEHLHKPARKLIAAMRATLKNNGWSVGTTRRRWGWPTFPA